MGEGTTKIAAERASQCCIEPACGASYAIDERLYSCPRCGDLLEIVLRPEGRAAPQAWRGWWEARAASCDPRDASGVWRYREVLPFADDAPIVTLGEGNTPLYDAPRSARYCGLRALQLKHQGCNPTGSFKDTGMTAAVTQAVLLGARTVVCASTGNTAASLAAYAARAQLQCAILVPGGQISSAKLAQSMDYGAVVLEMEGNFDDAMRVIREVSEDDSIYLVNSINPFRIEGQKTVAAELLRQCTWRVPDHVVVPGGNMGNSAALGKGFLELFELGVINRLPKLTIVQAEGAAPLAHLFAKLDLKSSAHAPLSNDALVPVEHPETLATAIKIGSPVSWKKSLRAVLATGGQVLSVSEREIADAKAVIGRDGVGCEPASATTVAGIKRLVAARRIEAEESVVAVLTGHLLKDPDYVIHYHRNMLRAPHHSADGSQQERSLNGAFRNPPARLQATKAAILDHLSHAAEEAKADGPKLD